MSKSANLIGRIVFDAARQTKKTNPRRLKKNGAFTRAVFRVGVHTHIGALCLVTRRQTSANIMREIRPGVYGPLRFLKKTVAKWDIKHHHTEQFINLLYFPVVV